MKKFGLYLAAGALFACMALPVAANTDLTLDWDGKSVTVSVPDEVAAIANGNMSAITSALSASGKDADYVKSMLEQITTAYDTASSTLGTATPYTTSINGLDDFTDVLVDVIPNTQGIQNVWAESWIGYILPKPNFGFGVNAGMSSMDITALTDTAKALGMDVDAPDKLVFPTITADARVGGFILPFDVGFVVSSINSSKLGLDNTISPVTFNYATVGADVRYCVWKMPIFKTRVSVGAGFYHTKGTVEADDSSADAKVDFTSNTLSLSAQASASFLLFKPFIGTRVMFSKTNVDWSVSKVNWAKVLGDSSGYITQAQSYGLLPTSFDGGSDSGFFNDVRPVLYGGFALSFLVVDLTVSGSYDFLAQIPSGAVSLRLSM